MRGSPATITLAMAAWAAACCAQGWQPLAAPTSPPPPCTALRESPGMELVIERGRVGRTMEDGVLELQPTNGVPVEPRTLAVSPSGAIYVAAANGLFVTHREVRTIDRLDFDEGGPRGAVVGIVADRIDRLWLATPTQLFVVHAGLWFHREHTAADGLPSPPFLGLHAEPGGRLVLRTAAGDWAYAPDARAPVLDDARVVDVAPGGKARLVASGAGDGALTYRYRIPSHHLLRAAGPEIDLRRPGRHTILVYGLDRDLDVSAPRELTVDVPFAPELDARHAAAAAAAFGSLLGAWLWVQARRRGCTHRRGLLDAGLAFVVSLQLGMAMTGIGRTYPFIGFTMYGEVYRKGDQLFTPAIVARHPDGVRSAHAGNLAFATDGVWRHVVSLLYGERAVQQAFVANCDADVTAVELRIQRSRLTADGPREVAPIVLARIERSGR